MIRIVQTVKAVQGLMILIYHKSEMGPWWCYYCLGDATANVKGYQKIWSFHFLVKIESCSIFLSLIVKIMSCHEEDTYLMKRNLVFAQLMQSWRDLALQPVATVETFHG